MMGYSISYVYNLSEEEINKDPTSIIWIIFDNLITLLALAYVNVTAKFVIEGEVSRNIATLHFLQMKLMNQQKEIKKLINSRA